MVDTTELDDEGEDRMKSESSGPVAGGTVLGVHNLAIVFPQFVVSSSTSSHFLSLMFETDRCSFAFAGRHHLLLHLQSCCLRWTTWRSDPSSWKRRLRLWRRRRQRRVEWNGLGLEVRRVVRLGEFFEHASRLGSESEADRLFLFPVCRCYLEERYVFLPHFLLEVKEIKPC